jgi:hypothetical protein
VAAPRIDTSERGRRPYRQKITLHQGSPAAARPPGAAETSDDAGRTSPLVYAAPVGVVLLLLAGGIVRDRVRRRGQTTGQPGADLGPEA